MDEILKKNRDDDENPKIREAASREEGGWKLQGGLLTRHGRLFVPKSSLRTRLIEEAHARLTAAHCGRRKLKRLLMGRYYWPGMAGDCERYVENYRTCKRTTVPRDKTPGLLHPLPIPDRPWQHIAVDFKSFPRDRKGYDAVCVVINRLTKRTMTLPINKDTTSQGFAELYYDRVWRLYGFPETMTSDRGPQFVAAFADELSRLCGVKQKLSTANHPQTDG